MKKGAKVAYVHSFYPHGVEIKLIFALRRAIFEIWADFKIFLFGHEIWNLKKGSKVVYVHSFFPRGSKLTSFSVYEQSFSRYRMIFKMSILNLEFEKR